jgi:hypothetical protein
MDDSQTHLVDCLEDAVLDDVHALGLVALLPEHLARSKVDEPEVRRNLEPKLLAEVGEGRKGLEEERQRGRQAGDRAGGRQSVVARRRGKVMSRVRDDRIVARLRQVPPPGTVLVRFAERKGRLRLRQGKVDRRRLLLALRRRVEGSPTRSG